MRRSFIITVLAARSPVSLCLSVGHFYLLQHFSLFTISSGRVICFFTWCETTTTRCQIKALDTPQVFTGTRSRVLQTIFTFVTVTSLWLTKWSIWDPRTNREHTALQLHCVWPRLILPRILFVSPGLCVSLTERDEQQKKDEEEEEEDKKNHCVSWGGKTIFTESSEIVFGWARHTCEQDIR